MKKIPTPKQAANIDKLLCWENSINYNGGT